MKKKTTSAKILINIQHFDAIKKQREDEAKDEAKPFYKFRKLFYNIVKWWKKINTIEFHRSTVSIIIGVIFLFFLQWLFL